MDYLPLRIGTNENFQLFLGVIVVGVGGDEILSEWGLISLTNASVSMQLTSLAPDL